jgi:Calcium binding
VTRRTARVSPRKQRAPAAGIPAKLTEARLAQLIEHATVDAYDESEQRLGFYTMMENDLSLPFTTLVLGVEVTVARIDFTEADEIVAICTRGRTRPSPQARDLPAANSCRSVRFQLGPREPSRRGKAGFCGLWSTPSSQ